MTEEVVNEASALAVPAIWSAITGIAGDLSALPAHVYRLNDDGGRDKADSDPLYRLFRTSVNDEGLTKVLFMKWVGMRLHIDGRAVSYLEKDRAGRVANIIPFYDLTKLKVERIASTGKKLYHYSDRTYDSSQVLDFVLNPTADGLGAISPIAQHRDTIGVIQAANRYCASMFDSGGVPLTIATMPPAPAAKMDAAADDIVANIRRIRREKRPVMAVPTGVEFKTLGIDAQKQQMIELRAFLVREVCRIFNVPPINVRDMADATFSNTEQQSLFYVQRTLTPIVEMIEAEINAKVFGKSPNFIEFDFARILRSDLVSQSEAYVALVTAGVMKPSEVRAILNLRPIKEADVLLAQGAMAPVEKLGEDPEPAENTTDPAEDGKEPSSQ